MYENNDAIEELLEFMDELRFDSGINAALPRLKELWNAAQELDPEGFEEELCDRESNLHELFSLMISSVLRDPSPDKDGVIPALVKLAADATNTTNPLSYFPDSGFLRRVIQLPPEYRSITRFKELLDGGCDPEATEADEEESYYENTEYPEELPESLLEAAIRGEAADCVKLLIEYGAEGWVAYTGKRTPPIFLALSLVGSFAMKKDSYLEALLALINAANIDLSTSITWYRQMTNDDGEDDWQEHKESPMQWINRNTNYLQHLLPILFRGGYLKFTLLPGWKIIPKPENTISMETHNA